MRTSTSFFALFVVKVFYVLGTPTTDRAEPPIEDLMPLPEGETWESFLKKPVILKPKTYFYDRVVLSMNEATETAFCWFYMLDKSEIGSLPFGEWVAKQVTHLNAETIAPEKKLTLAEVAYLKAWQEKFSQKLKESGKRFCAFEKPSGSEDLDPSIKQALELPEGESLETYRKNSVILKPKTFFYRIIALTLRHAVIHPVFSFYMIDRSEVGSLPFNEWLEKQIIYLNGETISPEEKLTLAEANLLKVWQEIFSRVYKEHEKIRLCTKEKSIKSLNCLMDLQNGASSKSRASSPLESIWWKWIKE